MKKDYLKKVRVCCEFVECTDVCNEVYKITLIFPDGYQESFNRTFYDINDAQRYCIEMHSVINACIDCFRRFVKRVNFGGTNDEK